MTHFVMTRTSDEVLTKAGALLAKPDFDKLGYAARAIILTFNTFPTRSAQSPTSHKLCTSCAQAVQVVTGCILNEEQMRSGIREINKSHKVIRGHRNSGGRFYELNY